MERCLKLAGPLGAPLLRAFQTLQEPLVATYLFTTVFTIRLAAALTNGVALLIRRQGFSWYIPPTTVGPPSNDTTTPGGPSYCEQRWPNPIDRPPGCFSTLSTSRKSETEEIFWWEFGPALYLLDSAATIFGLVLALISVIFFETRHRRLGTCNMMARLYTSLIVDGVIVFCYILGFINMESRSIDAFYIASFIILLLAMLVSLNFIICSKRLLWTSASMANVSHYRSSNPYFFRSSHASGITGHHT
ncbi:hypothetical protein GE061_005663 [Apolygus lucorum]|uniref:Uncharacterized protein n=1 Tax=Apolygus lucorum TaxID=248454 RepID=A0A8S9WZI8_APOLU|nr:hypothetical protein GE061_005663 [Apolygus lucorum]